MLEPVRASLRTNTPIRWNRVHDLPDFVYFHHGIHVQKGVGCVSCHGRVDQMPLTWKAEPMTMEWCLSCHRNPEKHLRPQRRGLQHGLGARRKDQLEPGPEAGRSSITSRSSGSPTARRATDDHATRPRPRPRRRTRRLDLPAPRLPGRRAARATGGASRSWPETRRVPRTTSHREFPDQADRSGPSRRPAAATFLRLMGASLALAGVGGCAVRAGREDRALRRGSPRRSCRASRSSSPRPSPLGGLRHRRPGREPHGPADQDRGEPGPPGQPRRDRRLRRRPRSSTLYDPDRSQVVTARRPRQHLGRLPGVAAGAASTAQRPSKGAGLRILTETVTSPTLARQIRGCSSEFPEAKWHQYEPVEPRRTSAPGPGWPSARTSSRSTTSTRPTSSSRSTPTSSPGAPAGSRYARELRRAAASPRRRPTMNRLYVVEPTPTITGAMADHRLAVAGARGRRDRAGDRPDARGRRRRRAADRAPRRRRAALDRRGGRRPRRRTRGASLVVAGETQPADVHALAHAINEALGNVGKTVEYLEPVEAEPGRPGRRRSASWSRDMDAGRGRHAPDPRGQPGLRRAGRPRRSPSALGARSTLSDPPRPLRRRDVAGSATGTSPRRTALEAWGDVRAFDGTATIQQPLIAPLYGGKSAHRAARRAARARPTCRACEIVRDVLEGAQLPAATSRRPGGRRSHDGVVAGTARRKPKPVTLKPTSSIRRQLGRRRGRGPGDRLPARPDDLGRPVRQQRLAPGAAQAADQADLGQRGPDQPGDGRAARAWTTSEVVELDYRRAERSRRRSGSRRARPTTRSRSTSATAGRGPGGSGPGPGSTPIALRTSDAPWFGAGPRGRARPAQTLPPGDHPAPPLDMAGPRRWSGSATVGDVPQEPRLRPGARARARARRQPARRPEPQLDPHEHGRGQRLGHGDQPERLHRLRRLRRRLPGREQHPGRRQGAGPRRGREMHWIDVDRYYDGDARRTRRSTSSPGPCMHCEKAPCELVCPVAATAHGAEGLNEMIYNRCVGTRYCGNNCPYKVRRFNFLQYADQTTPSLKLLNNPDVTVRTPGRDGEVHLLRAADQRGADRRRDRGPADPRRRGRDRLPGGLPDPGDRLRQPQRPGRAQVARLKAGPAELRHAGRAEHPAAHDVPGQAEEPEPRARGGGRRDGVDDA